MANNFIQVAPDSTGKMMQTYMNTIAGNQVHAEAVVLANSAGSPINTLPVDASGSTVPVNVQNPSIPVTGTFWQTLQPVSSPNASNFLATISGTISANAGANLNTALLALESGGNLGTLAGGVSSGKYQINVAQIAGTTADTNAGTASAGTLRTVIASDQSNVSMDLRRVAAVAVVSASLGVQKVGIVGGTGTTFEGVAAGVLDVNPRKKGISMTSVQYYVGRLTSKTTTYVTNTTSYASVIRVGVSNSGTAATLNVNDQSGSGNATLFAPNFPGGNLGLAGYLESYSEPIKYTNGIQIITGGTTFGDCNVAITYWQ